MPSLRNASRLQAVEFDEKQYWMERHERLRGDIRSVGNLGKSLEENVAGRARVTERLKIVLEHLIPNAAGRAVLDLGCGIGLLAPVLLDHGFSYTGVDVSSVAVDQARHEYADPRAEFTVGDLVKYEDLRRFDLVVASYVLVHLVEDEDWITTLRNIADLLRDDGYFILIDDVPETAPPQTQRHVVTRSLQRYREVLPQCGLRLVEDWFAGGPAALALASEDLSNFVVAERHDAPLRAAII